MKKVYSNSSEVIHLFANQLQSEATNASRNIYFIDSKIYSYGSHYLLGEFIDNNTIIINDLGYSVTTSKHINELTQATSHKKQFFTTDTDPVNVLSSLRHNARKLANARKPELYTSPSLNLWKKLNEFIIFTGRKEIKRTIEYKEIKSIISAIEKNPKTSNISILKFDKSRVLKEKKIAIAKIKTEKKEFKSYKRNRLSFGGRDLLRISKNGLEVETSQGVKITINEAQRLLKLIESKKIIGAKIDNKFIVDAFNGFLKVGCHSIEIEEINEIKQLLS